MTTRHGLWPWAAGLLLIVSAVAGVSYIEVGWLWRDAPWKPALFTITVVRHLIELLCVCYAVAFIYAAVRYVRITTKGSDQNPQPPRGEPGEDARNSEGDPKRVSSGLGTPPAPPLAVIYLCCNDLEQDAVRSLSTLNYDGPLLHIMHDDSTDPEENRRVDRFVDRLAEETGVHWRILRRSRKSGGKPGALQHILRETADEHALFLLLDNDSYVCDREVLNKALPHFDDPGVGVVQFRNRTRYSGADGPFGRIVAGAVDIFDAFGTGLFARLWRPFVGHNAVLRTGAVIEAGGFTPGVFADDIDLTVRMNLRGRRVVYRRDLAMEECHPPNYRSFSLRSKKWAHGCAQIIRAHLLPVLGTDSLTFREKLGFLLFTGFYVTQVAMLLYMALIFIVLPLMIGPAWKAAWWALFLGTIVPASIFLPVIAYLLTEGRNLPFFRTLGCCAATYGSTDLWTMLGLSGGFRRKERGWIPTNSVLGGDRPLLDWGHFAAGGAVLLVPLTLQPELLLFPLTWLFAAKFLFVPAVAAHYRAMEPQINADVRRCSWNDGSNSALPISVHPRSPAVPLPWLAVMLAAVAVFAFSAAAVADDGAGAAHASVENGDESPDHIRVEVRGREILIDGEPTILRGIHYGPWRPGTGPGREFPYPSNEEIRPDLRMIRAANANTILVYDPPARLLDIAHEKSLNVIYVFNIQWWQLAEGEEKRREIADNIVEQLEQVHEKPAVIAWMLGNEIEAWVIDVMEPAGMREFLSGLRSRIREVDPHRPVTHGNWPLGRTLDLDQEMDIVSYNVYPFYPTEVAVNGFGPFIRDHLIPVAGERPFIVSEFGINTLEATPDQQAKIVRRCWWGLLEAGARGGVVFAFADEWWKNYDNPVRPPDYWRRVEDFDDHLTHNQDPEEHYGIVTAYRVPKPAYEAVRDMFEKSAAGERPANAAAGNPMPLTRRILLGIGTVAVLGLIAIAMLMRFKAPAAAP